MYLPKCQDIQICLLPRLPAPIAGKRAGEPPARPHGAMVRRPTRPGRRATVRIVGDTLGRYYSGLQWARRRRQTTRVEPTGWTITARSVVPAGGSPARWATLRFMKRYTRIGLSLLAILSIGVASVSANDAPSGLSAHITAATNRVSTLRDLEFSVVITNSASTNITIHPWILRNGLGTISLFDAKGLIMAQRPELHSRGLKTPTRAELEAKPPSDLVLKPGESYTLKYKLGAYLHAIQPGKYVAREGFIPSNEVEITVE